MGFSDDVVLPPELQDAKLTDDCATNPTDPTISGQSVSHCSSNCTSELNSPVTSDPPGVASDLHVDLDEFKMMDSSWDQDVLLSNAGLPETNPLLELDSTISEDFQQVLNDWESHIDSLKVRNSM